MQRRVQCPFCFEKFSIEIFIEDGEFQEIIYDCEVCCHPIEIRANWDMDQERFVMDVQRSTGFD